MQYGYFTRKGVTQFGNHVMTYLYGDHEFLEFLKLVLITKFNEDFRLRLECFLTFVPTVKTVVNSTHRQTVRGL